MYVPIAIGNGARHVACLERSRRDAVLGRWGTVDPMAEDREWLSPYNFLQNNPINRVDPTGTLDDWIHNNKTKEYVWDGNVTKPSETPEGFQYVGASLNDVRNHFEVNSPIASFFTNPKFGADRTSWPGEILPANNLTSFEMWLDSPSKSFGESIGKIGANIGYSIVNSPYSLLTGETIGGRPLNGSEKMDAFIDVAPALISFGLTKTRGVGKTTNKGLQGYNQFVKRSQGVTSTKGLPAGMKWQQRAGQLFQRNKVNQQSLKDFSKGLKATGVISSTKKELEK